MMAHDFAERFGLGAALREGLFGGSPTRAVPTPTPPPRMPDPQAPDVKAAQARDIATSVASGGRSSTVLTTPQTRTLAGGAYAAKQLGG